MRARSVVWRMVSLHVVTICVASILMPFALYEMLKAAAHDLHHRALAEQADEIARYVKSLPDGALVLDLPPRIRELYSSSYGRYEFAVLDAAGQVVSSSVEDAASIAPNVEPQPRPVFFERAQPETPERQTAASVVWGGSFPKQVSGRKFWIQVSEDIEHRDVLIDDIVADFFASVGWITIPILLLLLMIDVLIFWRALRPVIDASSMAQNIGPTRTDVRLPTEGMPREILPLVMAVNEAFDRLDKGFRVQREFTADAAHELRTPLTILRTHIDMLEDNETARSLRSDIAGMSRIVDQLLEIAELEALVVDRNERADLRAVCSEVAIFVAPLALGQGKEIAVTGAEGEVWVRGNSDTLFQAIRNLVENAIAHTPEGTAVELHVDVSGTVEVLDAGPGVPEDVRQLIFQRFWRADRRRAGGGGLGLSIVSRIVEAHGGRVTIADRPTGGAVFSVRLVSSANLQGS
jgi:signal transduction histidine kinase